MGEVSSLIHDAFIPMNSPNCSDGEESLPTWQITDPQGLITLQLAEIAVSALNNNGKIAADSSRSLKETEKPTTTVSIFSPSHTTEEERSQPLLEIVDPGGLITHQVTEFSVSALSNDGLVTLQLAEFAVLAVKSNRISVMSTQHSLEEIKEFYASTSDTIGQRRSPQPSSTLATSETINPQERTITHKLMERAVSTLVISKRQRRDVECIRPNKRKILSEHNYALKSRTKPTKILKLLSSQAHSNQPDANGAMYTISRLLQDKSFQQQLPKLIEDEKMMSSDDDLNLTVQPGQTIQLVWQKFIWYGQID